MPTPAKDPAVRRRTNKTTTRAVLKQPTGRARVPALPTHIRWYPIVREWWKRVWSSPMVPEWTESDKDALYLAARLQQQFWDPETKDSTRNQTSAEIRQIMQQCGLTPMSRRSLQWEIERVEDAQARSAERKATKAPAKKTAAKTAAASADPRARFQVVPGGA